MNKNFKKYFLVILFGLAFSSLANAAKLAPSPTPNTVKGEFQVLPPLQPTPVGIAPNYGSNIQYSDPAHPVQQALPTGVNHQEAEQSQKDSVVNLPGVPYEKSDAWIWWVLIVIVLFGGGIFIINKVKK